ncbi:MAG: hypothetical protein ABWZ02_06725 [Nakamurella sp.]
MAISWRGRSKPELLHADQAAVQRWLEQPLSVYRPIVLVVALAVSLFLPSWGLWLLLLLIFDNAVDRLIARMRGLPAPDPED